MAKKDKDMLPENGASNENTKKTRKEEHGALTFFKAVISLVFSLILFADLAAGMAGIALHRILTMDEVRLFMDSYLGDSSVKLLKFASSWLLVALLAIIFVLLVVLLFSLNKRYLYKFLFYFGLSSALAGASGVLVRLFPAIVEKQLTKYLLMEVGSDGNLSLKGLLDVWTSNVMQLALILLGTGAACILLYMIIKGIVSHIQTRREEKVLKERLQQEEAKETEQEQ